MRCVQHGERYPDNTRSHENQGTPSAASARRGSGSSVRRAPMDFFPTARQLPPLVNLPPLGVQPVTMAAAPVPDARATRVEC
jgi:hypothetical protein